MKMLTLKFDGREVNIAKEHAEKSADLLKSKLKKNQSIYFITFKSLLNYYFLRSAPRKEGQAWRHYLCHRSVVNLTPTTDQFR
jgi:hypothetical protein